MSYLVNPVPSGTKPSATFNNLNTNASTVNSQYGTDHVAFDAGANNGQHQKISFPLALSVTPTPTGDQQVIYPVGTGSTLGLSIATAAGIVGLSNIQTTTIGTAPFQLTRMVLPSGLILYYGIVTNTSGASSFTITYTNSSEVSEYATISPLFNVGSGISPFPSSVGTGSSTFTIRTTNNVSYTVLIITQIP